MRQGTGGGGLARGGRRRDGRRRAVGAAVTRRQSGSAWRPRRRTRRRRGRGASDRRWPIDRVRRVSMAGASSVERAPAARRCPATLPRALVTGPCPDGPDAPPRPIAEPRTADEELERHRARSGGSRSARRTRRRRPASADASLSSHASSSASSMNPSANGDPFAGTGGDPLDREGLRRRARGTRRSRPGAASGSTVGSTSSQSPGLDGRAHAGFGDGDPPRTAQALREPGVTTRPRRSAGPRVGIGTGCAQPGRPLDAASCRDRRSPSTRHRCRRSSSSSCLRVGGVGRGLHLRGLLVRVPEQLVEVRDVPRGARA